jgi:hypothetical protein
VQRSYEDNLIVSHGHRILAGIATGLHSPERRA